MSGDRPGWDDAVQAWLDYICPLPRSEHQDFYRETAEGSLAAVYPLIVAAVRADVTDRVHEEIRKLEDLANYARRNRPSPPGTQALGMCDGIAAALRIVERMKREGEVS